MSVPPSAPRPPRPSRRTVGQGQWALGHLEPLNPNERTKKDDDGLNVRQRIETIYSVPGFSSIDGADLTDRQNIQLHWIRIEDVPEIWRRLEGVGLSTTEACGDTPRNMLGCPLAGVDAEELLDATPVLHATNELAEGNKEFSNLPR